MKKIFALLLVLVCAFSASAAEVQTSKLTIDVPDTWTYEIDKDDDIDLTDKARTTNISIIAVPHEGEDLKEFASQIAGGFTNHEALQEAPGGGYQFKAEKDGVNFSAMIGVEKKWIIVLLIGGNLENPEVGQVLGTVKIK